MAKRKTATHRNHQDRFMVYMIFGIVLLILIVITVKSVDLRAELESYNVKIDTLNEKKQEEEQRAAELEELEKTVKTKGYAEEVARDVLGLVYEDEIQFIEEK